MSSYTQEAESDYLKSESDYQESESDSRDSQVDTETRRRLSPAPLNIVKRNASNMSQPMPVGPTHGGEYQRYGPRVGNHAIDYLDAGHAQVGHPQVDHLEVGNPGVGHLQVGRSQVNHSRADYPQFDYPQVGHPEVGHPVVGPAQVGHAQAGRVQADRPQIGYQLPVPTVTVSAPMAAESNMRIPRKPVGSSGPPKVSPHSGGFVNQAQVLADISDYVTRDLSQTVRDMRAASSRITASFDNGNALAYPSNNGYVSNNDTIRLGDQFVTLSDSINRLGRILLESESKKSRDMRGVMELYQSETDALTQSMVRKDRQMDQKDREIQMLRGQLAELRQRNRQQNMGSGNQVRDRLFDSRGYPLLPQDNSPVPRENQHNGNFGAENRGLQMQHARAGHMNMNPGFYNNSNVQESSGYAAPDGMSKKRKMDHMQQASVSQGIVPQQQQQRNSSFGNVAPGMAPLAPAPQQQRNSSYDNFVHGMAAPAPAPVQQRTSSFGNFVPNMAPPASAPSPARAAAQAPAANDWSLWQSRQERQPLYRRS